MAKLRLTDARIRTLNPEKATRDVRDAVLRGFGVRTLPSGLKRFFIDMQFDGQRVWKLIGDADVMCVAEEVFRRYARH